MKTAFVAMPFKPEFSAVYDAITFACGEAGSLAAVRVDRERYTGEIKEKIHCEIEKAKIVIADMTGHNPNVVYEAGRAEGQNKPVFYITQSLDDIPFDFRGVRHFVYKLDDLDQLKADLAESIKSYLQADTSMSQKETIATGVAGGAAMTAGVLTAVSVAGTTTGITTVAGVTSGLAAVGGSLLGGMVLVAAAPMAGVFAGYGLYRAGKYLLKHKKNG